MRAEEECVKRVLCDVITDALEEAVAAGKLRRTWVQYWYEQIGLGAGLVDLVPTSASVRTIREKYGLHVTRKAIEESLGVKLSPTQPLEEPKPMKSNVLLIDKAATFRIPEQFTKLATAAFPSIVGAAGLIDGKFVVAASKMTYEEFLEQEKAAETSRMMFSMQDGDVKENSGDDQPFILLQSEGKNLIAGFFEGEFIGGSASNHTAAFDTCFNTVEPKVKQYWNMLQAFPKEQQLPKLMEFLNQDIVHKEMSSLIAPEKTGSIHLVGADGTVISYLRRIDGKANKYAWGWVSSTVGYAPAAPALQPAAEQPKKSIWKNKSVATTPAPEPAAAPVTIPAGTPQPDAAPGTTVEEPVPEGLWYDEKSKKVLAQCPAKITKKEDRKAWWNKLELPVPVGVGNVPGPIVEVAPTSQAFQRFAVRLGASPAVKDTSTHNPDIAANNLPTAKHDTAEKARAALVEKLPILSAEQKDALNKYLKNGMTEKVIKDNKITDPSKWNEVEAKYPTWMDITGQNLEETLGLPYGILENLAQQHPAASALRALNLAAQHYKLLTAYTALAVKHKELEQLLEQQTAPNTSATHTQEKTGIWKKKTA